MAYEYDPIFAEHTTFMTNAARKMARDDVGDNVLRMVNGLTEAIGALTSERADLFVAYAEPLAVVATDPADGEEGVAATDTIVVTFNHPAAENEDEADGADDISHVASIAFGPDGDGGDGSNDLVDIATIEFAGNRLIITLDAPLDENEDLVTVTLGEDGVKDAILGLLTLEAGYEFSFTLSAGGE